jgi:hypothetical protein
MLHDNAVVTSESADDAKTLKGRELIIEARRKALTPGRALVLFHAWKRHFQRACVPCMKRRKIGYGALWRALILDRTVASTDGVCRALWRHLHAVSCFHSFVPNQHGILVGRGCWPESSMPYL